MEHTLATRLDAYKKLVRLDKPIGTLLLLWPTLIALWIASAGKPSLYLIVVFSLGTLLMRSAGCAINDWADRDFDRHVARTAQRPLTSGRIAAWEALVIALLLTLAAAALLIGMAALVWQLAVCAVVIAGTYPFFKRFFAIPQAYLGIAFGFGIPMAFAAVQNAVPPLAWWLLLGNVFWAIAYDTEYAMVDRADDLKIGIKTSAITFGRYDVAMVMLCYSGYFAVMAWVGLTLKLGSLYWLGIAVAVGMALYHYTLIRTREPKGCFAAFLHNNWLGAAVFAGLAADYALG